MPAQNRLIQKVARADRLRLLSLCEPTTLVLGEVICGPSRPARYLYFPTSGFISMIALVPGTPGLEVGMIGREGMLGAELVLGVATSPLHAVVQGTGSALRIGKAALQGELARSPSLRRALDRYIVVVMAQLATSAACVRFHQIGPRLARWLLMTDDRAQSDTFEMTQEFLAHMLGVRRVGVTAAARDLQRQGLIEYHRGTLSVLDRDGLEGAACTCYASDRLAYSQQFD